MCFKELKDIPLNCHRTEFISRNHLQSVLQDIDCDRWRVELSSLNEVERGSYFADDEGSSCTSGGPPVRGAISMSFVPSAQCFIPFFCFLLYQPIGYDRHVSIFVVGG